MENAMLYQAEQVELSDDELDNLSDQAFEARTRQFHVMLCVAAISVIGIGLALSLL